MQPETLVLIGISAVVGFATIPILFKLAQFFGTFAIVREREGHVYTLFGKVLGILDKPGLHIPITRFGPKALLVPFFGRTG